MLIQVYYTTNMAYWEGGSGMANCT